MAPRVDTIRYFEWLSARRVLLSTAFPPRPPHPSISAVVSPERTCYGASIPSRRRPSPPPLPPTTPFPMLDPRPRTAHPVSSPSSPSHANPCHRSSTREQSNSGFPSRTLTSLCTSHVHRRNAAPEETSGGTRRTTSSKCLAHSAQGYARVIIETRSRASRAC